MEVNGLNSESQSSKYLKSPRLDQSGGFRLIQKCWINQEFQGHCLIDLGVLEEKTIYCLIDPDGLWIDPNWRVMKFWDFFYFYFYENQVCLDFCVGPTCE